MNKQRILNCQKQSPGLKYLLGFDKFNFDPVLSYLTFWFGKHGGRL